MELCELPEECISHILSLTSPVDVVRSMAVSKKLLSAANSDTVWENFLPSDYNMIMSQWSTLIKYQDSKKDLFFLLTQSHLLFNDNTMSLALDKRTGKKCYMIGAKALTIAWEDRLQYWVWKSIHDSRFPLVAELKNVCWLDIKGEIHTKLLTSNTTYAAYFVFKVVLNNNVYFHDDVVKVSMLVYDDDSYYLNNNHIHDIGVKNTTYLMPLESGLIENIRRRGIRPEIDGPTLRGDGWLEIEMGKYRVGANHSSILRMSVNETEIVHWKHGIIVQGIELRPLD